MGQIKGIYVISLKYLKKKQEEKKPNRKGDVFRIAGRLFLPLVAWKVLAVTNILGLRNNLTDFSFSVIKYYSIHMLYIWSTCKSRRLVSTLCFFSYWYHTGVPMLSYASFVMCLSVYISNVLQLPRKMLYPCTNILPPPLQKKNARVTPAYNFTFSLKKK